MRGTPAMNGDNQPTDHYQAKYPNHLTCPITQQLLQQAVETDCGHRFSLKAIEKHMNTDGSTCPCCKIPISPWEIAPQPKLDKQVFSFVKNNIEELLESDEQLDEVALFLDAASILGVEACEAMQSEGLTINATDSEGRTPLAIAVHEGNTIAVSTLLKAGADTSWHNQADLDLLMIAASQENFDMCNTLLSNGFPSNRRDHSGKTAFLRSMAASTNHESAMRYVRLFMNNKQDPLCTDANGKNAFDYALKYHSSDICKEMLVLGNKALKLYAKDFLVDAIMRNDTIQVKALLAAGAVDVIEDSELYTLASRMDNEPVEALILETLMEACPEELNQVLNLQQSHAIGARINDARRVYLDLAYLFFLRFNSHTQTADINDSQSFVIWRQNHLRYLPLNLETQTKYILLSTLKRAENLHHDDDTSTSSQDWSQNWFAAIKHFILLAFSWLTPRKRQHIEQATSSFKTYIQKPNISQLNDLKSHSNLLSESKFGREVIVPYILMMNYSMKRESSSLTNRGLLNSWIHHEERRLRAKTPTSYEA